jgi:hypothetical protein
MSPFAATVERYFSVLKRADIFMRNNLTGKTIGLRIATFSETFSFHWMQL